MLELQGKLRVLNTSPEVQLVSVTELLPGTDTEIKQSKTFLARKSYSDGKRGERTI